MSSILFRDYKQKLLSLSTQDEFLARVIRDLGNVPDIRFSWFCPTGMYTPDYIRIHNTFPPDQIADFVLHNKTQAGITLSRGSNFNMIVHSFFHELVHCYQDASGLFLCPLIHRGSFPVMPDLRGFIKSVLFCEAWAETESIRISWRLKQKGFLQAWHGVMQMPQWQPLAMSYQNDIMRGEAEEQAAANILSRWYAGRHRRFYEHQAIKMYQGLWKECACQVPEDIRNNLRSVILPDFITRIPAVERPAYFDRLNLAADEYNRIHSMYARRAVARFEEAYGATQNDNMDDFSCGTLLYLKSRTRRHQIDKIAV